MRLLTIFFVWLFLPLISFSQCDSLQIEINRRGSLYNPADKFEDRMAFVNESISFFIRCGAFSEAAEWISFKAEVAKRDKKESDKLTFLNDLEIFLNKNRSNISDSIYTKCQLERIDILSDHFQRRGQLNRAYLINRSLENFLPKKKDFLSDESLKFIVDKYLDIGEYYYRLRQFRRSNLYYKKALDYIPLIRFERAMIAQKSNTYGFLTQNYLKLNDRDSFEIISKLEMDCVLKLDSIDREHFIGHHHRTLRRIAENQIALGDLDKVKNNIENIKQFEKEYNFESDKTKILEVKYLIEKGQYELAESTLFDIINDITNAHNYVELSTFAELFEKIGRQDISVDLLQQAEAKVLTYIEYYEAKQPEYFVSDQLGYAKILSKQILLANPLEIESSIRKSDMAFAIIEEGMKSSASTNDKLNFADQAFHLTDNLLFQIDMTDDMYTNETWLAIESSKAATSFQSWLQNQIVSLDDGNDIFFIEENLEQVIQDLKDKILKSSDVAKEVGFKNELRGYEHTYDSVKNLLQREHPSYYDMKYNWHLPSLKSLQDNLAANEVFVDYFSGQDWLYAMIISDTEAQLIKIDSTKRINDLIEIFSLNILQAGEGLRKSNFNEGSFELYKKLIFPFKDKLKEKLIIAPSGNLFQIPFAALLVHEKIDENYSAHDFLISEQIIQYTPSGSFYCQQQKLNFDQNIHNALVVAPSFTDPTYDKLLLATRAGLGTLSFNIPEAKMVSKFIKSKLLIDTNATKENTLNLIQDKDLIHLSTHAKSNADDPNKSFIAFYEPHEKQGNDSTKLFLDDLSKLNISAKMIVLSACETGLGKIYNGEGAMSLSKASFYAGAQSVTATLWSIPDRTTHSIMTSFYTFLDKGIRKDKALQLAQLEYLNDPDYAGKFSHPYYWAGFTLTGDSDAIKFVKPFLTTFQLILLFSLFLIIGISILFRYSR